MGGPRATVLALALLLALPLAPALAPQAAPGPAGINRPAAADWTARTLWGSTGTFADFPDHIVFPEDSAAAVEVLRIAGRADLADPLAAARAAVRLQGPDGGFNSMAGDPFGPFVDSTRFGVDLALDHGVPFDQAAAAAFLKSMQQPDGGFAPRANRDSFVDSTHHAVHALDRLGALDAATAEAAEGFLRDRQQPDGGWPVTGNPNDRDTLVGPTWHAVEALALMGALDELTALRAAAFVLPLQQLHKGGFLEYLPKPCFGQVCPDVPEVTTYSTSRALRVLQRAGLLDEVALLTGDLHAGWLAARQIPEGWHAGAFDSYEEPAPITRYPQSTVLALQGLAVLGALDRVDLGAAAHAVARMQHSGTGGFGWWAGYISRNEDTEAALRALDLLGALDRAAPDALAATFARFQRADGAITEILWSWEPKLGQAAAAVMALALVDRLGAVDAGAAMSFLAGKQVAGSGFQEEGEVSPSPRATRVAVEALAAGGRLDLVDADGVAAYFADLQEPDGRISRVGSWDYVSVWDTADALRALAVLGRLDAVDVPAAAGYLAQQQRPDGTYRDSYDAAHVVLGLHAAGRLGSVDGAATARFLQGYQTASGGLSWEIFTVVPAMQRHAAILQALGALGAL